MRTFVALELPERFAIETAALSHKLETTLEGRFLPPCTHHLTLAFLGEVGEPLPRFSCAATAWESSAARTMRRCGWASHRRRSSNGWRATCAKG